MRKLVWFTTGFAIAAALTVYVIPSVWWLVCGALAVFLILFALILRGKARKLLSLIGCGLCLGFFWCSAYQVIFLQPAQESFGTEVPFSGTVVDEPTGTAYGVSVAMVVDTGTGVPFRAKVYMDYEYASLPIGAVVTGTGTFKTSEIIQGEKNYSNVANGIYAIVSKVENVTVDDSKSFSLSLLPALCAKSIQEKAESLFSGDALGLVKALLTGERDSISDSLYQSMQRAGAAHIVSVSGLHVLMLTQLLLAIPMEHRRKRIVLIPFLVFFAMMTGGRPAIVRAVLMVILLQLGPLFDRDYDAPTSLAAALLLLLLHNPFSIGGVGLQLSFAAVGGILLISNPLNQWFEMRLKVIQGKKQLAPPLRGICGIVSMSCGALLFSTPLCAYYFGYISLVGLLSSILILPVLGVLFATSLLSILLSYFAMPLALPLATVSDVIAGYVNFVCRQLGSWNFSALSMEVDAFVIWLVLVYACIIALFLWKWLRRKFYLPVAFAGISLLCSICFHIWNTTSAPISITVLDVGQGQCIAALSDDESIAVDCGGNSGDAGDHLADFLQNLNRRHLDALVLTHFDSDHTNGLSELFSRIQIDTIYAPDLGNSGQAQVVKLAEKNGCDVVLLSDDDAFSFGEGTVRLLHLPATEEEVENNDGISVLLSYEADDFLITGDLDLENEALLVESEDLSDIEYLVAGHHGSKYASSDALLAAITPDTAIISVGYNTYGHPTEDALNRLNSYVKELYRTDENGSVLIKLGVEK